MKLSISHKTVYSYSLPVKFLPHLLYLRPRGTPLLQVDAFAFKFTPDAAVSWMLDDFDNMPASIGFSCNNATLEICSESTVTTADTAPFDFLVRDTARSFPFLYEPLHQFNLSIYLMPPATETQIALRTWLDQHFTNRPTDSVSWLFALNETIFRTLQYQRRDDPGIQSSLTTLKLGTGSCRDYAVLLIECARTLGLAARFVSGYLYDPAIDGNQSGDMHAWGEVFLPGAGWRGLDPTHGIFCTNAYVPVARAVVAESVNPIQGSFVSDTPTEGKLSVDVRVKRL